jgi:tellurite resistance protein TerC
MLKFAWLKRAVVAVIGFTVLLIGVAMVVLPGPAIVVIPLGLAILATEFVWARRLLAKARATIGRKESRRDERTSFADDQNGREP